MVIPIDQRSINNDSLLANCSSCGACVLPANDGLCPNCGRSMVATSTVPARTGPSKPPPIAGWLVLPALGLLLGPVRTVYGVLESWQMLNRTTSSFARWSHPSFSRALEWGIAQGVILLCIQLWVAMLFFRKKRFAPRAYIILLLAGLVSAFVEITILTDVPGLNLDGSTLLPSIIPCAIWIPYFIVSQRVKNTFTVE